MGQGRGSEREAEPWRGIHCPPSPWGEGSLSKKASAGGVKFTGFCVLWVITMLTKCHCVPGSVQSHLPELPPWLP